MLNFVEFLIEIVLLHNFTDNADEIQKNQYIVEVNP